MKVALIHDWLTGMRGGERCLEVFCELFPEVHGRRDVDIVLVADGGELQECERDVSGFVLITLNQ